MRKRGDVRSYRDLTDREWKIVSPLLPPERGRNCRPALDNRPFANGMLWIAWTGQPWRNLPREYGKWNSVYQRFRRWKQNGVWARFSNKLAEVRDVGVRHRLQARRLRLNATGRMGQGKQGK